MLVERKKNQNVVRGSRARRMQVIFSKVSGKRRNGLIS